MTKIKYLKMGLEKEIHNAAESINGMSDHATNEEIEKYLRTYVTLPIEIVLHDFDIDIRL